MFMVYDLCDTIRNYLNEKLNEENKILIYDQLMKIMVVDPSINDDLLDNVRSSIGMTAFGNKYFNKISENSLIDILSFEFMDLDECFLLKSCLSWINQSKAKIEDKKTSFKTIRSYIDFRRITVEDFKNIKEIDSFLNTDEINALFLFLLDKKNKAYPLELKTKRKYPLSADFWGAGFIKRYKCSYTNFSIPLTVSHDIFIRSVETVLPSLLKNLEIKFFRDQEVLEPEFSKVYKNGSLILIFLNYFVIKAGFEYKLTFNFDSRLFNSFELKNQKIGEIEDEKFDLLIQLGIDIHCIKKINFFIDSFEFNYGK